MISKIDILALCGLEGDEVDAIAEFEHMPDVAAAALGSYLLHQDHGVDKVRDRLVEDLRAALDRGETEHAGHLFMALRHFVSDHPDAV